MSATGLGTQEQSFPQLLFLLVFWLLFPIHRDHWICAFFFKFHFIFKLYIIVLVLPNIKMNLCLLTVTLVAVFMHWVWKRDFLSCNVLNKQTNKTTCSKIQSELLQDRQGLGKTFALIWKPSLPYKDADESFAYCVVWRLFIRSWNLVNGWVKMVILKIWSVDSEH